jgi:hypothetical protein
MLPETAVRAYFGDSERTFCLTLPMVFELERLTGVGVGALFERLTQRQFRQVDINETIRLALIGGGCNPVEVEPLVGAYVIGRPLSETYPLALSILEALWFGNRARTA